MLFCITLGDWLGKGHDIKEDFCTNAAGRPPRSPRPTG